MNEDYSSSPMSFLAPVSSISPSFWEQLYDLKLNRFHLDSSQQPIRVHVVSSGYSFDADSFALTDRAQLTSAPRIPGYLMNVNTIEVS
jgi:hypothetical protein